MLGRSLPLSSKETLCTGFKHSQKKSEEIMIFKNLGPVFKVLKVFFFNFQRIGVKVIYRSGIELTKAIYQPTIADNLERLIYQYFDLQYYDRII